MTRRIHSRDGLPPNDLDAERGILARALEGDVAAVAAVAAPHFFFAGNRAAYVAVSSIVEAGGVPTIERVARVLRGLGGHHIDRTPVDQYLRELLDGAAWGATAQEYATRVVTTWRARESTWLLERAAGLLRTGHDRDRVIAELGDSLRKLSPARARQRVAA